MKKKKKKILAYFNAYILSREILLSFVKLSSH